MAIELNHKSIDKDSETYFIADIAANHDGDLQRAKDLIFMAKDAGADCAKFQHFKAKNIVSGPGFLELSAIETHQTSWEKPVEEVYEQYHTKSIWDEELISACAEAGIEYRGRLETVSAGCGAIRSTPVRGSSVARCLRGS